MTCNSQNEILPCVQRDIQYSDFSFHHILKMPSSKFLTWRRATHRRTFFRVFSEISSTAILASIIFWKCHLVNFWWCRATHRRKLFRVFSGISSTTILAFIIFWKCHLVNFWWRRATHRRKLFLVFSGISSTVILAVIFKKCQ